MDSTKTNLETGFLSAKDREAFLKEMGLTESMSEAEAQALRDEWPDRKILRVIGAGLF